ncbi:uncharacterized protein V6R79_020255 [Siganus canaliculatus]
MHSSEAEGQSVNFWRTIPTKRLLVYDYRFGEEDAPQKWISATGMHFNKFLECLHEEFTISSSQAFVLTTTDRTVLDFDKFSKLENNNALYLLHKVDQELAAPAVEQVNYTPHYDTLIRGGEFNYNVSEGKNPLPYAIAELVDNALWATSKNTGERMIEMRLLFDETTKKNAVIVLDNGCGMNSKQLSNWAVYKLSKFSRENHKFASKEEGYVRPDPVPRSLNSDISFFGVGGKQAAFYIGKSVRMISKAASSPDVHELVVSEEEFKRKESEKEEIFSGKMLHRQAGDFSHIKKADESFLRALIAEESGKESFTAVVITGVMANHIKFLKDEFAIWTRQLAHVYHYYIHGVRGNNWKSGSANSDVHKLDILITLREKSTKCPRVLNLREIEDDLQTLFINTAEDTFEFTAQNEGKVDGVIRYHPFRFDRETYPKDPSAGRADCSTINDEDESESEALCQARGNKPIFECFWNGRLIPYTKVTEFDWCAHSKTSKVPAECYNRISGVLFTDDRFKVTTNKLTFMDLEFKLRDKSTIFSRVVNGQPRRSDIKKDFTAWLQKCHETFDKQIKFIGFKKTIERPDPVSKKRPSVWSIFSAIEWDRKVYKAGQLLKTQKTGTNFYGTVVQFLLYGEHKGDVYATGGEVEITLEPKAFYDMNKIIPISKMDRTATDMAIRDHINSDFAKLPDKLKVDWPEGNPWPQNAVRPAGTPLGPLRVEILNKNEESLSTMPSVGQGQSKKLIVVQKRVYHGVTGDQEDVSYTATHSAKWNFWFKKMEVTRLGKYTLFLNVAINEKDATVFGGRELPCYKLSFTIKEGGPESFVINSVHSSVNVGVPFNIPLVIKDAYGHPVIPSPDLKPEIKCSFLDLSYEKVTINGTLFTIRGVTAKGKYLNYQKPKSYPLAVTLPGLTNNTQSVNIILLPGKPHLLRVMPENDPVIIENGNTVMFNVEVHDEAGNITLNQQQIVCCQVEGHSALRMDYTSTGGGTLVTNQINVKITKGEPQKLKVQFEMPNYKKVAPVVRELKVLPSTRVSWMELYSQDNRNLVLRNKEKIEWLAGGSLENLHYRLFDEADKEVPLNPEIASKIKVNWTSDANLKDLINGKLPDIQVPAQVESERFYQVSYQDQSVSISFHITPRPDEPTALKASLPTTTVMLGEVLTGHICLELVDQYGNLTKTLTSTCVNHMCVEAEGLDKSAIRFTWEESNKSVLVTGLQFQSGPPSSREICFTYKSFVAQTILKVSPGAPTELKLISEPEKPLQVLNSHGIAKPFVVQLCDKWGNPSPDQRVVLELVSPTPALMVKTDIASQPVNSEGKAAFTVTNVSGPKGQYKLHFIASFNQKPIPGPSVSLTVMPDPNRPVGLTVKYDTKAKFPAGGKFPVFSVTVMSDEGCPMKSFNPADFSMFVWQEVLAAQEPPQSAIELKCSKPMENEKKDCFHFRDKVIPEQTGKHTVQFLLRTGKAADLFSRQISINVVANQPVKLGPDKKPITPVVSYSKDISCRTLVQDMTLRIRDSYDNPAGLDLNGKVMVSIKNCSEGIRTTLPRLDGTSNQFSLVQGKAHITNLAIMENSPGEDGSSYILLFKPEVMMFTTPLTPFELSFCFYNDSENQQKMSALTKKKDELTAAIAKYRDLFSTYKELVPLLTEQYLDASNKMTEQIEELMRMKVKVPQPASVQGIEQLLKENTAEAEKIQRMKRRVCSTEDPFRGQQDVLGMVCHLAYVEDDGAARVISWHIGSLMDCVITKTTPAARRIYDNTQGRQQVMPLDGVLVGRDRRLLPHIDGRRRLFEPRGNPVYARQLLIFPRDGVDCDTVFRNILGDTILIDDLDSANHYRVQVVQNGRHCPTILTRQGDRVAAKGNFGGLQNKAPQLNQMQRVFGAPCPELDTLREQKVLLNQLYQTIKKRDEAAKERDHYLTDMRSPEMMRKQQDMKEKEKELEDIKRHMSTPGRPVKRCLEYAGETCGMTAKKAK